ncbi:TnsA endonuclease N-terminal domain-containing protein [Agrobacterium cavarae]|uniref:TnsA endonuclease N-terminal domain-containing protein n=1 Tax=Agrobacterium cavarae TaxID=2528239 RepID=UPI0028A840B5|nr:TnsA endonuclease N-terminal domain-containing protein [Agrobacterium cavarae]
MNWKGVLDFLKEKKFGLDRKELVEAETSPVVPDDFCAEEVVYEMNDMGEREAIERFVPPTRSTATRKPPARTKGHSRGSMVDPRTNRAITFASAHEWRCALILLASPEIAEVYDQPPAITYVDAEGKKVKHTPDYLAVSRSGKKCAIAVKPSRRVEKSGIVDTLDRIKPILGDYADDIILLTELQLTHERATNAESALQAHSCRVQADCDRVAVIMSGINGEVNAYDVAKAFGDFPRGMNAIWCLVYDGIVKLANPALMLADHPFVFRVLQATSVAA